MDAARIRLDSDGNAEAVDPDGRVIAVGHLVLDLMPDATATDKLGSSVRFVGEATAS